MRRIDLRSDTITQPTPAMRRAMMEAEVGDDVLGDDPTVMRLEEMAAQRLGKEAGLFVASGTMGNLVSLLTHCGRGDEAIIGDQAHVFYYEQGGMAALGGIQPRTIRNQPDGTLDLNEVEAAIRSDNIHFPRTRLIAVENTHNRCGGAPLTPQYMHEVGALACKYGLRLHVDGARLFNSAIAQGVAARELVADADSVTFCLSKGLCAPIGSVVCGSRAFIAEARRNRKVVGGGMRQVGVIAAAGIVALTEMVDRLAVDHSNARRLAAGLSGLSGLKVEEVPIRTNILFCEILRPDLDALTFVRRMADRGVYMMDLDPRRVRAVTNYHVSPDDIEHAIAAASEALQ